MDDSMSGAVEGTEKELASLQQEVSRLRRLIASQGAQAYDAVRDHASDAMERAKPQARQAAARLRSEGTAIADLAREHPSAATATLLTAGALGFLMGYLFGMRNEPERTRYWSW